MLDLRETLNFMATTYDKDIILVEVAYCWKPIEYKTQSAPFPETPQGQREFLEEVNRIVMQTPNNRGKGLFWWEAAVDGHLIRRSLFDDEGNVLPAISVFDRFTRGKVPRAD